MATKNELLQKAWREYEKANAHEPRSARQAVEWAVSVGVLTLPRIDPYDVLAGEMAHTPRRICNRWQGQAVSRQSCGSHHQIRCSVHVLGDHGIRASRPHGARICPAARTDHQRLRTLRTDVDAYNDMSKESPIQLVLDFTEDVAERQVVVKPRRAA